MKTHSSRTSLVTLLTGNNYNAPFCQCSDSKSDPVLLSHARAGTFFACLACGCRISQRVPENGIRAIEQLQKTFQIRQRLSHEKRSSIPLGKNKVFTPQKSFTSPFIRSRLIFLAITGLTAIITMADLLW